MAHADFRRDIHTIHHLFDSVNTNDNAAADVNALYTFLSQNGAMSSVSRLGFAANIAAKTDNVAVLEHIMAKLGPHHDVTMPFYSTIDCNANRCFNFLCTYPALDVMHQDGVFFRHAIYVNSPGMLSRLCLHTNAKLDSAFLNRLIPYALNNANYTAARILRVFLPLM